MDLDEKIPPIAPHLINEELRLPSSFRTLCAQISYTNEEIGRIVRCLALDTTVFSTPRIAPDIEVFDRILKRREKTRQCVLRFRARKSVQASGNTEDPSVVKKKRGRKPKYAKIPTEKPENDVVLKPVDTNTVQSAPLSTEAVKPQVSATPIAQAEAPSPVEVSKQNDSQVSPETCAHAPVVPVAKPAFIEKVIASRPVTQKTRAIRAADKLSYDLFTLMGEPDAPKRPMPTAPAKAIDAAQQQTVDTRHDSAWITVKFAMFWKQYPRKVAKGDAVKAFTKLIKKQVDVDAFMRTTLASLEWWKQQPGWTKDNGKFIPYPASWLNGGHWEDSVDNKDMQGQSKAEFLRGDAESDDDLLRRMQGG